MPRRKGQPYRIDISGQKFGQWTVISRAKHANWLCQCSCGTEKVIQASSLKLGRSKSCGCMAHEVHSKHGMEGTATYSVWGAMLYRCRNPKAKWYRRYGGRGIRVCKEWEAFERFFADMGEKPRQMTLERRDNDGPYCKENCYWASVKAQIRNREKTPMVQFDGRKISVAELAELHGLRRKLVYDRIRRGWSVEEAVSTQRRNQWGATKSKVKT